MRAELEKGNTSIRNEKVQAARNELLNSANEKIQHTVANIKRAANERVMSARTSEKKELLKKREDIIKSVFEEAERRIKEYMNTEPYRQWLEDKIKSAVNETGGTNRILYVREEDLQTANSVLYTIGESEITVHSIDDKSFLGGIKMKNDDILTDYSFGELLRNQRDNFLQMSRLTIE